jgi:DNA repair protein RadD
LLTPRYYQADCVSALWDYFNRDKDDPVVAMPTGTGKSLVIAMFNAGVMQQYPSSRLMCLTHVKELIEQNSDKLKEFWPGAPYGIYSAGLKKKQKDWPITFGGVKSVVNCIDDFGHIDLLTVDEAHLINDKSDSDYGTVIGTLRKRNPKLKVIKLTATPYRTGTGMIAPAKDICYDLTGYKAFNRLIDEGYLCRVISKRTATKLNIKNVGVSNGDYAQGQLEKAIDREDVNYQAVQEMCQYGYERVSWVVFCAGIKHSEHVAKLLNMFGITAAAVHSKMPQADRDAAIKAFKCGKLRCLVNFNVVTTGFDHPPIDFIGMLRPTMSTGLWVQMVGRGTRPSPDTMKQNCLVLDFAANTPRLGPINDPVIPRPKGSSTPGTPPVRICDNCGTYNYASARFCETCGFEFPRLIALNNTAGNEELLRSDLPQIEWFSVQRVVYNKLVSQKGENFLKVTYVVAGSKKAFSELVALEKTAGLGAKARKWWMQRMGVDSAPPSVDEALKWVSHLQCPKRIQVHVNKQYPDILHTEM